MIFRQINLEAEKRRTATKFANIREEDSILLAKLAKIK